MQFSAKVVVAISLTLGSVVALALDNRTSLKVNVSGAWIEPAEPGALTANGYLKVETGGEADQILRIESPVADAVTLREEPESNRDARTGLSREWFFAGAMQAALASGSPLHLTFSGLKVPLAVGDTIPVTVTFERAGVVDLVVPVVSVGSGGKVRDNG